MIKKIFICMMIARILNISSVYAIFDPTRPPYYYDPLARAIRQSEVAVTGIVISQDRRIAIVNDHIVTVGDEIFGLKVIAIESNRVEFRGYEGYFFVPLLMDFKK